MHYYYLQKKKLNRTYRFYRVYRYKYCILLIEKKSKISNS